ncbi:hypothetical protein JMJ35_008198 [Cladonia borealis]|uniref:Heterokaryon incompatibility domain-containing protein n=1 Tax=Cladonia borealis TaxID=184061 RepID=A0AA39V3E4_9LECA|nr:hypothetical protein JMJ35_008198 [Cladonia borealis]
MRLLSTCTFELKSFYDEKEIPRYAILSHTWETGEEITLQELQQKDTNILLNSTKARVVNGEPLYNVQNIRKGFIKIVGCALQAEKDGFKYIWCDTCCIDKTDFTELSEAINSMFHWYRHQLCYAYLGDVPHAGHDVSLERGSAFAKCRWFKRGWTLQELIAPSRVVFFDQTWQSMGTRSGCKDLIAEITGIDREVLDGEDPALSCIAKRMSWASKRETTRVEDLAYCLMGLFGVNMPLIYGERHKAFIRLQTEIMRKSDDHSLFAWKSPKAPDDFHCGLLAGLPNYFAESRNISPFSCSVSDYENQSPFSMTNRGVSISLPIIQVKGGPAGTKEQAGIFLATLDCQGVTDARGPLGIYLHRSEGGYYRRCYPHQLIPTYNVQGVISKIRTRTIYIAQDNVTPKAGANSVYRFHILDLPEDLRKRGMMLELFVNEEIASWDPKDRILCCSRGLGASIYIGLPGGPGKILLIGIDPSLSPRCVFDDRTLLVYPSEEPGTPAAHQKRLDKLMAEVTGLEERSAIGNLKQAVKAEASWDWDRWVSSNRATSALLELTIYTSVENTAFFRKKIEKIRNKVNLKIDAILEETVIKGQRMFLARFVIPDWRREVRVREDPELQPVFHEFCRAWHVTASKHTVLSQ